MNISKSFISDVAKSMEKYGFSAGGSGGGGGDIIIESSTGNPSFITGSYNELLEMITSRKFKPVYLCNSSQFTVEYFELTKISYNNQSKSIFLAGWNGQYLEEIVVTPDGLSYNWLGEVSLSQD